MKNLILITNGYPYFGGEPFIKNELPYLATVFNKIYIFSIYGTKHDEISFELSSNSRCYPLEILSSKIKYLFYFLHGICNNDEALEIQVVKQVSNNKSISASLYFRGIAKVIAVKIYSIIIREKLDVKDVVIYSYWFAYQAIAAWLLSTMLSKKLNSNNLVFARAHGYDLYWERNRSNYLPFQDITLKHIKYCFPCSEFGKNYILSKFPWANEIVKISKLGTFDYGLNPYKGEKVLVTCCNLEPLKRMPLFAKAFCSIAKREKDLKWICIGDGVDYDKIKCIIESSGITSQVSMLGRISNDEVMRIYQTQGIMYFCNVSTTEGLPVSIMEAMSFGIPIIATDVGGISELVNKETGILLNADLSVLRLSEIILYAINVSHKKSIRMRSLCRKKWEDDVSANKNYSLFANIISNNN